MVSADAGVGVVTPPGPTIRGNPEKGEEVQLTATLVAVFLLILFGAIYENKEIILFNLKIKNNRRGRLLEHTNEFTQ